eukprot:gene40321-64193_t
MLARTSPKFEPLDPHLRDLYRAATPTEKLKVVVRLNTTLIELKSAALQAKYPAMPPAKRSELLRRCAGIPYAIVGSVASSVYGEPRATNDVDLLIQLSRNDAAKLVHAFPTEQFYVPPAEVIAVELGRPHGGHINVIALESMTK